MKKHFVELEKPLDNDEVNDRLYNMIRERARQRAEAYNKYHINPGSVPQVNISRSLNSAEVNERIYKLYNK